MSLQEGLAPDRRTQSLWPDWSGEVSAIIASGPSLKNENLELLRGRVKIIAIKQSFDRCPFADVVYGCDAAWWIHRNGLPEFSGLKIAWGDKACDRFGLRKVTIAEQPRKHARDDLRYVDDILTDHVGTIGAGGNSGFQALNLDVQFGSRRVLLVGFDMHDRNGVHWYGRNNWAKSHNPDDTLFPKWRVAFDAIAPKLRAMGVEVVNTSTTSDLKCFPHRPLEQALRDWKL